MVSKNEDKYVIYPVYFDKNLSKSEGRKIAIKNAVDKPNIEAISKAAKSLGLHPVLEKNVCHPSHYWKKEGRLLIDKKDTKSKLLVQIANRLY
jgi:signal recognition particle subunit SRP19